MLKPLKPNPKQRIAYGYLLDKTTEEVYYGGAAGGGKSFLGCEWLTGMCIGYPGTGWFIGREQLNDLRINNLQSMLEVYQYHGMRMSDYCTYNGSDTIYKFYNGSFIKYLELKYYERDPYYESLGSTQYTGGWIEEAGPVHVMAYETLKARIGRWNNDRYGLKKKMLVTMNPNKGWTYGVYKRSRDGQLPPHQKFVKALVSDNIYGQKDYEQSLRNISDPLQRARLLDGDWEYDNDPTALMDHDAIKDIWNNVHVRGTGNRFITCDVARKGNDKTVIVVWDGWIARKIIRLQKLDTVEVARELRDQMQENNVAPNRTVADEDGVGGGVVDIVGCKGFTNNARAIEQRNPTTGQMEAQNYSNLRSQCYFILANKVNDRDLFIQTERVDIRSAIEEELEQIRRTGFDEDKRLAVVKREEIVQRLGRSPDFASALMMRGYFELKPVHKSRATVYT